MLRDTTGTYDRRWVAQTKSGFNTEVRQENVEQHHRYWDAIVRAVETSEFDELMALRARSGPLSVEPGLRVRRRGQAHRRGDQHDRDVAARGQ
jgi:hypothetical protein